MIYSNSMKALPVLNQNLITNIIPVSSNLYNITNTNFQPLSSFGSKYLTSKNDILSLLTEENLQYKNVVPLPTLSTNRDIFGNQIYNNNIKHASTMLNYNPQVIRQRHRSYENVNVLNFQNYDTNNQIINDENTNANIIIDNIVNNPPQKYFKGKASKIPHPLFNKKKRQQNIIFNYPKKVNNDVNYQFYLNQGNSQDYNNLDILANNTISTSSNNISYENMIPSYYDMEPGTNINLSEYDILNQIGQGSEGAIYVVKWKKNNKNYAMKKCSILLETTLQKRKSENIGLRKFIEGTGCDGVIKVYGNFSRTNELGMYEFYEVMELAEKDWEKEIIRRRDTQQYYQEYELMEIFKDLIKTFSLLQNNKITHRDIKPQNIMIVNGKLKICDFGNARILKRDGIIIQKIRGSELFMSPIVFKGYRLAASLSFGGPNIIREVYDMKTMKKVLNQQLQKRYSQNLINLILTMLQIEESKRPDFNQLELMVL